MPPEGYVKNPWAVAFANAFKDWLDNHGYSVHSKFQKEYSISKSTWEGFMTGGSISLDVVLYAIIFKITGLPQADPRTLPDKLVYSPNAKSEDERYRSFPRAWTEDEYQSWVKTGKVPEGNKTSRTKSQSKPSVSRPAVVHAAPRADSGPTAEPDMAPSVQNSQPQNPQSFMVGDIVNGFFSQIATQMGNYVAVQVNAQLASRFEGFEQRIGALEYKNQKPESRFLNSNEETSLAYLALQLETELKPYVTGSREDRDRLIREYGLVLGKLWAVMDPLMQKPEQREVSIRMQREVGSGS